MKYDVVIIGAGHAGVEAVTACARKKVNTLLVTFSKNDIGQMSCNPAIGGLGKGHIVREIDALDGVMATMADKSGIQFRVLNKSKGPAVQGPRAQIDRKIYQNVSRETIENYPYIDIVEDEAIDIELKNDTVTAIVLKDGGKIPTKAVVVTSGTFLNGLLHVGGQVAEGGRINGKTSKSLADFFRNADLDVIRLKTGTPPRLDKNTINFDILSKDCGDETPECFSYLNKTPTIKTQVPCYITHTNSATHEIIQKNLSKSAIHSGNISGPGPRYCPSIEDKISRFKDKDQHQIFLEPEGLDSALIYPNGISTSLPRDVQEAFLRTMKGLEFVKIAQYGYAVEYDCINPKGLNNTLQVHNIRGLFLAGQINGTTGYEEAAGQGLVAGINAAIFAKQDAEPFVLSRSNSYIGVMIDDITNLGVSEPYRMFTSRSEFRILLRSDNADRRLTEIGYNYGVVSEGRYNKYQEKITQIESIREHLGTKTFSPDKLEQFGVTLNKDGTKRSGLDLLSISNIDVDKITEIFPELINYDQNILQTVSNDLKYNIYAKKHHESMEKIKKEETTKIPHDLDYTKVPGLSNEMVEFFNSFRPQNMAAIMRSKKATPASIVAIFAYLKKVEKDARK